MKTLTLTFVVSLMITLCTGQSSHLLRPSGHKVHPQIRTENKFSHNIHLRNDFNEQVDSAWLREFSDVQGVWVTTEVSHFTYNDDHALKNESYFSHDIDDGAIYNGGRDEYFYNDLGQVVTYYYSELNDVSGSWDRTDREEFVYNEDLRITEDINSSWNEISKDWNYTYKFIYAYTPTGKTKEYIYATWDGSIWQELFKTSLEYNAEDYVLFISHFDKNDVTGEWDLTSTTNYYYTGNQLDSIVGNNDLGSGLEPSAKTITTYNTEGLLSAEDSYWWDGSTWQPNNRYAYEYTPEGNLLRYTYLNWSLVDNDWVNNDREEYTYTASDDQESSTYYLWDEGGQEWIPDYRTAIAFDEQVDGATIVWPVSPLYDNGPLFNRKPLYGTESEYNTGLGEWVVVDSTLIFYGDLTTSVKNFFANKLLLYPNPSSDQIRLQFENPDPTAMISIFNQEGKLVLVRPLINETPITTSSLTAGVYTYIIRNGKETYTGTLVRQ